MIQQIGALHEVNRPGGTESDAAEAAAAADDEEEDDDEEEGGAPKRPLAAAPAALGSASSAPQAVPQTDSFATLLEYVPS